MDELAAFDAILEHLSRALGVAPRHHWRVLVPWADGGPDPLDSVSAYDAGDAWHYVGLGMSELGAKRSANAALSGWGFELTCRVPRGSASDEAPTWPLKRLNDLARYVWQSRNPLRPGDFMDQNGPLSSTAPDSAIVAAMFTLDPVLGSLAGPNGRVNFVQLVGVTADELVAAQRWDTQALLDVLVQALPRWETDLARRSVLETRPDLAALVRDGTARDGSSNGGSFTRQLAIEAGATGVVIEVGAITVPDLLRGLELRVPYGREFVLSGPDGVGVRFVAGDASGWDAARATLTLTAADARALAAAVPQRRGEYGAGIVRGVRIRIVPTEIRGSREELVRVLG